MVNAAWTHARWVVIALLVSLALNIFLIGMTGGHHMRGWYHDRGGPSAWMQDDASRPLKHMLRMLTHELDDEDREQFRAAIEAQRDLLADSGAAMLEQRRLALELLRAEPFDRTAVDAALAELGRRHDAFHRLLMAAIADAAAALPPEARAKLGSGWY